MAKKQTNPNVTIDLFAAAERMVAARAVADAAAQKAAEMEAKFFTLNANTQNSMSIIEKFDKRLVRFGDRVAMVENALAKADAEGTTLLARLEKRLAKIEAIFKVVGGK